LVAAGHHSCVKLGDGATKCWGRNNKGQIGDGTSGNLKSIPTLVFGVATGTVSVGAGFEHACALVGEAVVCWGDASAGQLGDGTTTSKTKPVAVSTLATGAASLATGQGLHTCAILKSGAVNCWGANGNGQTGKGSASPNQTTPVLVDQLGAGVTAVTAGASHTCALVQGPKVQCWGHNDVGQMGDGTTGASQLTPTYVLGFGQ
jgi:alpha-tubulin suppressor-like RCC1 family protein